MREPPLSDFPLAGVAPVVSPGLFRCWQIMTGLDIATRVDAIDYLWTADDLPILSIEDIRRLVQAFPLVATHKRRPRR
jgi:hypothetical protein